MAKENARAICWVVTDGRAGIEVQALGLAEAIARSTPISIETKRLKVRAPHRSLPRLAWGDPFAHLDPAGDALSPPWPDLWIGCGRQSVPFSMAMRARSPGVFIVQLQNPRAPLDAFDLVIPPVHDGLGGENVFSIIGSPNRIDAAQVRAPVAAGLAPLAVLVGGPNRAFSFNAADAALLAEKLVALSMPLDITLSRRTPRGAAEILRARLGACAARFHDPARDAASDNPYPAMLGSARAVLVTEDSVNMAAEAAATAKPVYILPMRRKPFANVAKFNSFHESLRKYGASRRFCGEIEAWTYEPLDETARAATEVIRRWRARIGR